MARLLADPRHFERSAARAESKKAPEGRLAALLKRYLAAVEYVAATLEWSEASIMVHTVETLDPGALDPWIRRWAGDGRPIDPALARVPPGALAIACGHVDAVSFFDALSLVAFDHDQAKLANIETALSGFLLGQDLRTKVLPELGPGVIAYVDAPADTVPGAPAVAAGGAPWPLGVVVAVSVADTHGSSPPVRVLNAVDNALRTVLALSALDEKRALPRAASPPRRSSERT